MLTGLLKHRFHGRSPGAKFFLLRLVQMKELDKVIGLSVREIAKQVGLTPDVASLAIEELVGLGLLTKQPKRRLLGRPSNEYLVSKSSVDEFLKSAADGPGDEESRKVVEDDPVLRQRLERLIGGAVESKAQGLQEGRRLMYANRLLLAVLVAHADEFGVVRKLGWRDLGELTGLQRSVLRQRLEWMLDQGYLRSMVPGATGSGFIKKAKSEYVLNLAHPLLRMGQDPSVLVVRTPRSLHVDDYPARQILNTVMREQRAKRAVGHEIHEVVKLFGGGNVQHLTPMLQASINHYASYLLSEHFEVINENEAPLKGLRARILSDVAAPDADDDSETATLRMRMVQLLCDQSVDWALSIRAAINGVEGLADKGAYKYWLLPPSKRDHAWRGRKVALAWTLLVRAGAESGRFGCRLHDTCSGVDRILSSDEELTLEERYFYGLLTKPKPKPKPERKIKVKG